MHLLPSKCCTHLRYVWRANSVHVCPWYARIKRVALSNEEMLQHSALQGYKRLARQLARRAPDVVWRTACTIYRTNKSSDMPLSGIQSKRCSLFYSRDHHTKYFRQSFETFIVRKSWKQVQGDRVHRRALAVRAVRNGESVSPPRMSPIFPRFFRNVTRTPESVRVNPIQKSEKLENIRKRSQQIRKQ